MANASKKDQGATGEVDSNGVGGDIKNLSTIIKSKKSKVNFSGTDFLIFEAKKAFMYLQKAFIKALIPKHLDPEYYIHIETDVLEYAIYIVLNQITAGHLDQLFSDHMTHKNLNQNFSKSEIDQ